MHKIAKASLPEAPEALTQTETLLRHNRRGRYGCQASRSRGTNWKITPRAWWPELPGKDMPKGWDLTWKPVYDKETQRYRWIGAARVSGKRMCLECRAVAVTGKAKRCRSCAKSRKRQQTSASVQKYRVSVRNLRNSPIQAEALTNEDFKSATTIQESQKNHEMCYA
jgi:hypothetical protein